MKKLTTLFLAFAFAGSAAFAQSHTATTNQSGTENTSTINQAGDAGNNTATVNQAGDYSAAIINQISAFGSGHTATINQSSGEFNFSDILQVLANAEASVTQADPGYNEVRLKQSGYNVADITQYGEGNKLGAYNNIDAGRAFQKNGTGLFAGGMNTLTMYIEGNYNRVGIDQEANTLTDISLNFGSHDNEIRIKQKGVNGGLLTSSDVRLDEASNNTIHITQGDFPFGYDNNYAEVHLDGDSHYNEINIQQEGNDNEAVVGLIGWVGTVLNNEINIHQQDNNNDAFIYLSDSIDDNLININQQDGNNRAQVGGGFLVDNNTIDINQLASCNNAMVNLSQSVNNSIEIDQFASGNTAQIRMGDPLSYAETNYASITQLSSGNMATISMGTDRSAIGNTSIIVQD